MCFSSSKGFRGWHDQGGTLRETKAEREKWVDRTLHPKREVTPAGRYPRTRLIAYTDSNT